MRPVGAGVVSELWRALVKDVIYGERDMWQLPVLYPLA